MVVIVSDRLDDRESFHQHRSDHLFGAGFTAASGNTDCFEPKLSSICPGKSLQRIEGLRHFYLGETVQVAIHVAYQRSRCSRLLDGRQESVPVKLLAAQGHKKFAGAN